MTSSKVTLRIPENKFAALSKATNIPEETLRRYATEPVEVNEKTAIDFRKIAAYLNVSELELVKPVAKNEAVRLRIRELAKEKGLNLKQLSQTTNIHLILVEFYSKQPIYKQKLAEPKSQENLNKICNQLGCKIEDLLVPVEAKELPITKLRVEELAQERGLSLNDLSLLTDLPYEFIDLLATQPIDASSPIFVDDAPQLGYLLMKKNVCKHLGDFFPSICKKR